MTKRTLLFLSFLLISTSAQAIDFGWLTNSKSDKPVAPADSAKLLTLEPDENEQSPKVAPDGKHLIVIASKDSQSWISRRAIENGDPVNTITEDADAVNSANWEAGGQVTFLSDRAGGLGLWQKAADGKGVLRRAVELNGSIAEPTLLADGSTVAVRLIPDGNKQVQKRNQRENFDNWTHPGFEAHIVRILSNGSEQALSRGVNPAISPDGSWVAFSVASGRSYHLFLMKIDGSELTQLTDSRSVDVQPAWSADGQWIVFTSNRAEPDLRSPSKSNWDIWAISRDGRTLNRLTKDSGRDGAPSVSKNGTVYFHSDRDVSKLDALDHQVKGNTRGFHIWSVKLFAEQATDSPKTAPKETTSPAK